MTITTWLALAAIFTGGVAIAVQAPTTARLAAGVGDPVTAATISFLVGVLTLAAITPTRLAAVGCVALGLLRSRP